VTKDLKTEDLYTWVEQILDDITLPHSFGVTLEEGEKCCYVQIVCQRRDTFTHELGEGKGAVGTITEEMNRSQVVRLVFSLLMAFVEHETREAFMYRERRVFGPHMDVDRLWDIAEFYDFLEGTDDDD
jgi:hypothetical protein